MATCRGLLRVAVVTWNGSNSELERPLIWLFAVTSGALLGAPLGVQKFFWWCSFRGSKVFKNVAHPFHL